MIILSSLGRPVLTLLSYLGELANLLLSTLESLTKGQFRGSQWIAQLREIGFHSQPVIIITGAFTGAVLAAQSLFLLTNLQMETMASSMLGVGMMRELGPAFTGLMLAGRVGASMAAEIGTMKVTEQIDALRSMDVNPIDYLVTPRFGAMVIAAPILISLSATFGIIAASIVGIGAFKVSAALWFHNLVARTELVDIFIAMVKVSVFGGIIVLISCHQGLAARNGAVGVGQGTTKAMVYSSLAVLVSNFFLTLLLNIFFPLEFGA